jgi:large subunit ribosomal protein L24
MKFKIKKGDTVAVIAGKDKGKEGKVTQILAKENRIVVEGVNISFKHLRAKQSGQGGQKIQFFAPIEISNVQLLCPKCKKNSRVGIQLTDDKKRVRICKKCQTAID